MAVNEVNERKVEAAALALLRGRAASTDGRLTMENLHFESGVSRATMNRSEAAAWFRRMVALLRLEPMSQDTEAAQRRLGETNARLRSELETAVSERDAAALTILALHRENQALRETARGKVRPLDRRAAAEAAIGGAPDRQRR